jgi:hypothetical protein
MLSMQVPVVVDVPPAPVGSATTAAPHVADVPVTGPGGLALTGGDIAALVLIALLLIAVGLAMAAWKKTAPRPQGDSS